jgi:hypothetical protein
VSNWDVQPVVESQGLGIVEGSTPSETEEDTRAVSIRRAGNVGASATIEKERERERKSERE